MNKNLALRAVKKRQRQAEERKEYGVLVPVSLDEQMREWQAKQAAFHRRAVDAEFARRVFNLKA